MTAVFKLTTSGALAGLGGGDIPATLIAGADVSAPTPTKSANRQCVRPGANYGRCLEGHSKIRSQTGASGHHNRPRPLQGSPTYQIYQDLLHLEPSTIDYSHMVQVARILQGIRAAFQEKGGDEYEIYVLVSTRGAKELLGIQPIGRVTGGYVLAYERQEAHRTSNILDPYMDLTTGWLEDGRAFHQHWTSAVCVICSWPF
jgi:hypothetical protein